MESAAPPHDPLRALFTGKRTWVRVPSSHPVTVRGEGEGGPYGGRVLELSRGGVQVVLEDDRFYGADVDGFAFVIQRFPDGAVVRFTRLDLERRVHIVRITLHESRLLALGCRFERPLTAGEAVTVGVAAAEAEAENAEATAAGLGWAARGDRPIAVLLRTLGRGLLGPYAIASVVAAGDRALDLIVPGAPESIAADLAEDGLSGSVVLGRRRLWEGGLRVVACEVAAGNGAGPRSRIRVVADHPLGDPVHRVLHVARRATD